ncbi:unnamed protein product [Paramecium primaurelia]|uniref:Uncharacterized protein n=1 Tax=Paramecium primaurelia TaxID=5886 RepID=A0A8S1NWW9_PARPR|nr:unnamed protein product [Paramecium primaurelia]
MDIFLYFIIVAGILQSEAIIINQPGNSIQNQIVEATQYACKQGYFFNGQICSECRSIENGFCTCQKYSECDQISCGPGYYLVGSSCVQHPDSNCLKGSLSSDGSGICIANNNCQQFDSLTGICKQCQSGYFISVGLGYEDSQTVSSTYYQSVNQCKQCQSNCLQCQNEQSCTVCKSGYFVQQNQCYQCVNYLSHCLTCDTASKCTSCDGEIVHYRQTIVQPVHLINIIH